MRDILVSLIVLGGLPFILSRPWLGVLFWSWLGYMNPHRLGWGFAHNMPFAAMVGAVTLISFFVSKESRPLPKNGAVVALILLNLWMLVTSIFSFFPEISWALASKVYKIQLMIFLTMMVMQSKERIILLTWVIALSIGFFGIKGGAFTLLTGGSSMVLGPTGTFISGNTEISLALTMVLPLFRFLHLHSENKWVRYGLLGAMALIGLAIIGSYSRGAFVAGAAMLVFLWWKSRGKLALGLLVLLLVPLALFFMPEQWFNKMDTIQTYDEDASAMGRINAWWFAFNLTKDYPFTGCGFNCFEPELFLIYAPNPTDYHSSHSIYFQMLGQHGYVGLILFLLFFWLAWRTGSRIRRVLKNNIEWRWAFDLASMIQVGLIGYFVGGAFLGLAYFDLPYHFVAILVLIDQLYKRETATNPKKAVEQSPGLGTLAQTVAPGKRQWYAKK